MTNKPSKETIMKTINITTDSNIEIRIKQTHDLDSALLPLHRIVDVITFAIVHRKDLSMSERDRKNFPTLIRDMYQHELLNIARIAISHGSPGLQTTETKKLILRVIASDSETFKLPIPLEDPYLCAHSLSLIACDTINAYLAPIKSFFTFDQVDELLDTVVTDIRDAIDCLDIYAICYSADVK
jgi:hypothetical protein